MASVLYRNLALMGTLFSLSVGLVNCSGNRPIEEGVEENLPRSNRPLEETAEANVPTTLENLADDAQASEGKTILGSVYRAQQAEYRIEGKFATTFDDLELGLPTETEQYRYAMTTVTDTQAIATATAKDETLNSYTTGVFIVGDSQELLTILCETAEPSQTPPAIPEIDGTTVRCAAGSVRVEE